MPSLGKLLEPASLQQSDCAGGTSAPPEHSKTAHPRQMPANSGKSAAVPGRVGRSALMLEPALVDPPPLMAGVGIVKVSDRGTPLGRVDPIGFPKLTA